VIAEQRLLRDFGDDEQQDEVEGRHVRQRAFAGEAENHEQDEVDDQTSQDAVHDVPSRLWIGKLQEIDDRLADARAARHPAETLQLKMERDGSGMAVLRGEYIGETILADLDPERLRHHVLE